MLMPTVGLDELLFDAAWPGVERDRTLKILVLIYPAHSWLLAQHRTAEDFDGESLGFFGSMDNNNETTMKSIVIQHVFVLCCLIGSDTRVVVA
ncbi:Protein CBG28127 [Caenorhabditis briggsae]|uniref:Protein CBG28127 n=1 Tax=Caenorhabditis briggsae TaxID=6238 RepID=B6IHW7_CAEBR|nr:Protein CBG28127 [Caenorhabditis briggsae]CAR99497.1 Protein CBG28127 [Caenorhabditis briggsae]